MDNINVEAGKNSEVLDKINIFLTDFIEPADLAKIMRNNVYILGLIAIKDNELASIYKDELESIYYCINELAKILDPRLK